MDRRTERRMTRIKRWRSERARELGMDPGVLCPNTALEAVAWRRPGSPAELAEIPELKGWFVRAFGKELVGALGDSEAGAED